jgi:hypothetical protein
VFAYQVPGLASVAFRVRRIVSDVWQQSWPNHHLGTETDPECLLVWPFNDFFNQLNASFQNVFGFQLYSIFVLNVELISSLQKKASSNFENVVFNAIFELKFCHSICIFNCYHLFLLYGSHEAGFDSVFKDLPNKKT